MNTSSIDFINKMPWIGWVSIIIVASVIIALIYIINHYGSTPSNPEQVMESFDTGEPRWSQKN